MDLLKYNFSVLKLHISFSSEFLCDTIVLVVRLQLAFFVGLFCPSFYFLLNLRETIGFTVMSFLENFSLISGTGLYFTEV